MKLVRFGPPGEERPSIVDMGYQIYTWSNAMKLRVAYIEEPPFYWTVEDHWPTGADIELAEVVLRAIGVSSIEYQLTSFGEFLPGVQDAIMAFAVKGEPEDLIADIEVALDETFA